jgi:hypothetical protein
MGRPSGHRWPGPGPPAGPGAGHQKFRVRAEFYNAAAGPPAGPGHRDRASDPVTLRLAGWGQPEAQAEHSES